MFAPSSLLLDRSADTLLGMRLRVPILAPLILVAACGGRPAPRPPSESFIRLERTPCLGKCPAYTITLYDNGVVYYEGVASVAVTGRRKTQADPGDVAQLMDYFSKLGSKLNWKCDPARVASDQPAAVITVSVHGRQTSVEHNHGDPCAPDSLFLLELAIDGVSGSRRWVDPPLEK
jgi:hypothetical protein